MSGSPLDTDEVPAKPAPAKSGLFHQIERIPQYMRILIAVALGVALGLYIQSSAKGVANDLKDGGMLVINFMKALATPLILFAVLDAMLRTHIPPRKGLTLLAIGGINAVVAITIGLGLANTLRTGEGWQGHLDEIAATVDKDKASLGEKPKLSFVKVVSGYVPESIVKPFMENNIIPVVVLALLAGAALRRIKNQNRPSTRRGIEVIDESVHVLFGMMSQILTWIVHLLPIAIFFVVAGVVGKTGPQVFKVLLSFLGTVVLGLFIHAVIYYSFLLWAVARVTPRQFFGGAMDAIIMALSCGSSLATLPTTLKCLDEKLKISPGSARLAACVGTNLNHDGIILYEAAATIFLAQALGMDLTFGQQITVAIASIMAGIGIAGVPEAGLITLAIVLSAAGVPDHLVPLVFPVDWIIGRCRAATNVISDMTVAQLLDKLHPEEKAAEQKVIAEPASIS